MNVHLALLLLVVASGCATSQRPTTVGATDPGRLPSAHQTASVSGLRPCDGGAARALHLDPSQPVSILVYGRKGSAAGFRRLAEALAARGQQTVCFDYDGRASLMQASGELVRSVEQLAQHLDAPRITLVGHSLGGLVARKALVRDRPGALRTADIELGLVTVSAPFSGVAMARACANPVLRVATLGIVDLGCWLISGDAWFEITPASGFIRQPGELVPQVRRHLLVVTDERGACRRRDEAGRCVEDDYVLSVAEQQLPAGPSPRTTVVEVAAGHSEIIGGPDVPPQGLIDVFQREGVLGRRQLASQGGAGP